MGDDDELFDSVKSDNEFARIKKILPVAEGCAEFKVYGGNHEFCKDDNYIEKLVKHLA